METTATIQGIQQKESKNGKTYYSVATDQGVMSCFDGKVAEVLKTKLGQAVNLDVRVSGDYKNINKVLDSTQTIKPLVQDQFSQARAVKNTSFYASYAKDIFLGILADCVGHEHGSYKELMEQAVDLTKIAIQGFE